MGGWVMMIGGMMIGEWLQSAIQKYFRIEKK